MIYTILKVRTRVLDTHLKKDSLSHRFLAEDILILSVNFILIQRNFHSSLPEEIAKPQTEVGDWITSSLMINTYI
jgi:hypothetical protein